MMKRMACFATVLVLFHTSASPPFGVCCTRRVETDSGAVLFPEDYCAQMRRLGTEYADADCGISRSC